MFFSKNLGSFQNSWEKVWDNGGAHEEDGSTSKHFGYLHTDRFPGPALLPLPPPSLLSGLSYNINKGSFRAGVLRNRGRGPVRAMLAMSGKGGMLQIVAPVAL